MLFWSFRFFLYMCGLLWSFPCVYGVAVRRLSVSKKKVNPPRFWSFAHRSCSRLLRKAEYPGKCDIFVFLHPWWCVVWLRSQKPALLSVVEKGCFCPKNVRNRKPPPYAFFAYRFESVCPCPISVCNASAFAIISRFSLVELLKTRSSWTETPLSPPFRVADVRSFEKELLLSFPPFAFTNKKPCWFSRVAPRTNRFVGLTSLLSNRNLLGPRDLAVL